MNFDPHLVTVGLVALYFRIFDFTYTVLGTPRNVRRAGRGG
jgi:hypothetical protein